MSIFFDPEKKAVGAASVAALRSRFDSVPVLRPLCKISDDLLLAKLRAAESEWYRKVRVFLEPTWVFADDATQAEIDARLPANSPYVLDAGYDYSPEFFMGESWGYLRLRQTPVIEIKDYRFVYSDPRMQSYTIPAGWIRLNRKYGDVRLVPTGESATLPLNAYLLNVFGGGMTIPQLLRITYKAGITDVANQYPDLIDFLYRAAALLTIRDRFPGASGSISVDGMSRSQSFDLKAYGDSNGGIIADEYASWDRFFHGIPMGVL